MSSTAVARIEDINGQPLDCFSFQHNWASCIAGIGGPVPSQDPTYAFHTNYAAAARGPARFTVRFTNLTAKRGTLWLRIHMLPDGAGAVARMANSERVQLNRLVALGGEITVAFEGFRGVKYALMGLVPDGSDARADGLTVTLDRPDDGVTRGRGALTEARTTSFGSDTLKATARMVVSDAPTLANPASQRCTAEQLAEPLYGKWLRALGEPVVATADGWRQAFLLQALTRYGVLAEGARGLLLLDEPGPLAAFIASRRTSLTVVHPGEPGFAAALARPALCDGDDWHERVEFVPAGLAGLPEMLANFDFTCSAGALDQLGGVREIGALIEESLECLRPAGLAVHLLRIAARAVDGGTAVAPGVFSHGEMERLALILISRGHEVAQLRLTGGSGLVESGLEAAGTPFGLIVRKARSQL